MKKVICILILFFLATCAFADFSTFEELWNTYSNNELSEKELYDAIDKMPIKFYQSFDYYDCIKNIDKYIKFEQIEITNDMLEDIDIEESLSDFFNITAGDVLSNISELKHAVLEENFKILAFIILNKQAEKIVPIEKRNYFEMNWIPKDLDLGTMFELQYLAENPDNNFINTNFAAGYSDIGKVYIKGLYDLAQQYKSAL